MPIRLKTAKKTTVDNTHRVQKYKYPYSQCSSGRMVKFVPYTPARKDKGRNTDDMTESICMDLQATSRNDNVLMASATLLMDDQRFNIATISSIV